MPDQHHNSDYVEDVGNYAAGGRTEWKTLPSGARIPELVDLGDLTGWQTMGDEDCGVSIRCPKCHTSDFDGPWIPVPAYGFGWLANTVQAALEHKCPEAGRG